MQVPSIYLVSFTASIGALVLWKLLRLVDAPTRRILFSFLRKKLLYTLVYRRRRGSSDISVFSFLSIIVFITTNIVACTLRLTNWSELARRCGTLFMINAVSLYLGGRTSLFADQVLRLPLSGYYLAHRWIGRVCVAQGLVHGIINATVSSLTVVDKLLLSSLVALGFLSLLFIRRYMYEAFLKSHLLFALGLVGILWCHIRLAKTRATICLVAASSLWLMQHIAWLGRLIYRNFGFGSPRSLRLCAFSTPPGSIQAMTAIITLKRSWKVRPGQYLYLTVPSITRHRLSFLQSHPYVVAWEDEVRDEVSDEVKSEIKLLIQRKQGFSNDLLSLRNINSAIIDGPYGHTLPLAEFDRVLFIASGIGIAAHLLAIKHLIQAHNDKKARVRRLTLYWFLETLDQEAWARQFLDALHNSDDRHIFTVILFVPPGKSSISSYQGDKGKRIDKRKGHDEDRRGHEDAQREMITHDIFSIKSYIKKEYDAEAGSMAVSVCGTPTFEEAVRGAVRTVDHVTGSADNNDLGIYMSNSKSCGRNPRDIYFFTSGFQPEETDVGRLSRLRYSVDQP